MTTYCKGCISHQQVRKGYYACANCPGVRARRRRPLVLRVADHVSERTLKRLVKHFEKR